MAGIEDFSEQVQRSTTEVIAAISDSAQQIAQHQITPHAEMLAVQYAMNMAAAFYRSTPSTIGERAKVIKTEPETATDLLTAREKRFLPAAQVVTGLTLQIVREETRTRLY